MNVLDHDRRLITSPWLWLGLTLALIAIRWCAVPTTADFGINYEPAWRIAHGEHQYADFYLTLPPLTNYTTAACILLFGESLWAWTIHLYLWWFGAMVVGLAILLRLTRSHALIVPTILLTAVFSSPPVMGGNSYDYAVTCLSGLMILAMLRTSTPFSAWRVVWIGFLGGLCVLTKQNVGAAMTFAAAAVVGWQALGQGIRHLFAQTLTFAVGFAIGFLPMFLWLAGYAGFSEVWLQMFHDAGAGKGGALRILLRSMPRPILQYGDFEYQRFVEAFLALAASTVMTVWLWRARGSADSDFAAETKPTDPDPATETSPWKPAGILLLLAALYAATLIEVPGIAGIYDKVNETLMVNPYVLFVELVYILLVATAGVVTALYLRQTWSKSNWGLGQLNLPIVTAWLMGVLAVSHAMTCPSQMIESAPVALPCLAFLLHDRLGTRRAVRLCWQGAVVTVLLTTLFSFRSVVFDRLAPFPTDSAFAGLYGHPDIVHHVDQMQKHVAPRIHGHSTLWLTHLGPHSAYGGLPVRNVAVLFSDTYHPRIEEELFTEWEESPPEYVVYGPFRPARGSVRLTHDVLHTWLQQRYRQVWLGKDEDSKFGRFRETSLWQRKDGGPGKIGQASDQVASIGTTQPR